jgi:hypothetical protein
MKMIRVIPYFSIGRTRIFSQQHSEAFKVSVAKSSHHPHGLRRVTTG